jgi:biotin-dependent carboxylase-like uncharacterized protein
MSLRQYQKLSKQVITNGNMIKIPYDIRVIKPGLMSSIQDLGRKGLGGYGVPQSGAMDIVAMQLANHLLQNPNNAAVLEMAHPGPELQFEGPARIVFTGAIAQIKLNDHLVALGQVVEIEEGDNIQIGQFSSGRWLYMAIQGGFESDSIHGSRSWYAGISAQGRLNKEDKIPYLYESKPYSTSLAHPKITDRYFVDETILVYKGAEWGLLSEKVQQAFLNRNFSLSANLTRMAYILSEVLPNELEQILTVPVYQGTVQLTPAGNIMILMRDAQVTGGYPRVLQVKEEELSKIAQKSPGSKVNFKIIPSA